MKQVPFYANTEDNTHCYQASLRMVLKYFLPEKEYTWKELDQLTGKKEGLWTWPTTGTMAFKKMGFSVHYIGLFNVARVAEEGMKYLREYYGDAVAKEQEEHSDIGFEQQQAKEFLKSGVEGEIRLPAVADLHHALDKGSLVICNVNAEVLVKNDGYVGHFVVIFGYDEKGLYLHDPGFPPLENRYVSNEDFLPAWGYPTEKAYNMVAFKL